MHGCNVMHLKCISSKPDILVPHLLLACVALQSYEKHDNLLSAKANLLPGKKDRSRESRFAAAGSTVAYFTTLGAQKFMNRAIRICLT